ncbi:VanZ family protein [Listeria kieliensis]
MTDFVFILYLVGLVLVTMFPLSFGPLFSGMNHPFEAYVQLVPFRSILEYLTDLNLHSCIQLFGNIFMLAPLAIYINAFYNWSFKKNLIFVCLFSFGIEFVQGTWDFFNHWPYKKVDIDDVFSNMTGYLLTLFFIPRIKKLYDKL